MGIVAKDMAAAAERRKAFAPRKGSLGLTDGGASREEIEIRLLEAKWRMAEAEVEQDYSLCSRLQRNIKELEARIVHTCNNSLCAKFASVFSRECVATGECRMR